MNGHEIPIIVVSGIIGTGAGVTWLAVTGADIPNILIAAGTFVTALSVAIPILIKAMRREVKAIDEKIAVVAEDVKGIVSQVNGINSRLAAKADAAIEKVHDVKVALVKKSGELDVAKGDPLGLDATKPPVSQIVQPPPEGKP